MGSEFATDAQSLSGPKKVHCAHVQADRMVTKDSHDMQS